MLAVLAGLAGLQMPLGAASDQKDRTRDDAEGWTLSQMNRLSGPQRVKIDRNHVKMENLKSGLIGIMTGPPWKVTFYNKQTKIILQTDYARLTTCLDEGFSGDAELDVIQSAKLKEVMGRKLTIAGQKTKLYALRNPRALAQTRTRKATYAEEFAAMPSVDPVPMATIDYWVASDIRVADEISDFICQIYRMPYSAAVPLRLKALDANGRSTTELDTFGCVPGKIPASEFAIPKGYRKAKGFREFVFGEGSQNQAVQMMQGFMESENKSSPPGDKGKKH